MQIKKRVEKLLNESLKDYAKSHKRISLRRSPHLFVVILIAFIIIPALATVMTVSNSKNKPKQAHSVSSSPVGNVSASTSTTVSSSDESANGPETVSSTTDVGSQPVSTTSSTEQVNLQTSSNNQSSSSNISVNGQAIAVPKDGVVNKITSQDGNETIVQVSGLNNTSGNTSNVDVNISDNGSTN